MNCFLNIDGCIYILCLSLLQSINTLKFANFSWSNKRLALLGFEIIDFVCRPVILHFREVLGFSFPFK